MNLYWTFEYIRVAFAYLFVLYLWPTVVFRRFLKDKGKVFQFGFCTTMSILTISTCVLLLGLMHILNKPLVFLLFYGVFLVQLRRYYLMDTRLLSGFKRMTLGTMKLRSFLRLLATVIADTFMNLFRKIKEFMGASAAEYIVLILLIFYGMLYFSWGSFNAHSYGVSDMYVHHSWIYGLTEGTVFSKGIYPEAMHTMIYTMSTCFGIQLHSILLFLQPVHTCTIIISMYIFLKTFLHSKFGPHIAILLFLILDGNCVDQIFGMARFQYTITQEFAMFTEFLGVACLVRYLNSKEKIAVFKQKKTLFVNGDLFIFMTCIATSIAVHFYVTGMMFFLCVVVAVFRLFEVMRIRRFVPLFVSVLAAVLIAVTPMAIAYAEGIPFQGSIDWALSVIDGSNTEEGRTQSAKKELEEKENEGSETEGKEFSGAEESSSVVLYPAAAILPGKENKAFTFSFDRLKETVKEWFDILNVYGYQTLYRGLRATIIGTFIVAVFLLGVLLHVFLLLIHLIYRKKRKTRSRYTFDGYLMIDAAAVLFMVLYAAPYFSMPELIAGARLCSTEQFLNCTLLAIPFDFLLLLADRLFGNIAAYTASAAVMIFCGVQVFRLDMFHGFLYFELTRYNETVDLTNWVISEYPKKHFTVVSTTDDLYHVAEEGYHEELLTFVNNIKFPRYSIPTDYIIIYLEKNPISYGQYHFFDGPEWLGKSKYYIYYEKEVDSNLLSVDPDIKHTQISEESANRPTPELSLGSKAASRLVNRVVMESQLAKWIELFEKYHPHSIKVIYEDEYQTCYEIKQNPSRLTNLAFLGEATP